MFYDPDEPNVVPDGCGPLYDRIVHAIEAEDDCESIASFLDDLETCVSYLTEYIEDGGDPMAPLFILDPFTHGLYPPAMEKKLKRKQAKLTEAYAVAEQARLINAAATKAKTKRRKKSAAKA